MPHSQEFYGTLIQEIAAPTFTLSAYDGIPSTSYFWKIITNGDVPEQVDMISLNPDHYLHLRTLSLEHQKRYLSDKFKSHFEQLRHKLGLG